MKDCTSFALLKATFLWLKDCACCSKILRSCKVMWIVEECRILIHSAACRKCMELPETVGFTSNSSQKLKRILLPTIQSSWVKMIPSVEEIFMVSHWLFL